MQLYELITKMLTLQNLYVNYLYLWLRPKQLYRIVAVSNIFGQLLECFIHGDNIMKSLLNTYYI